MKNGDIYLKSGRVCVNMDIIFTKTILYEDENIKVKTSGHDYDFIAEVISKTGKIITIVFDDESDYLPNIEIDVWTGLLANDEGYEMLEALANKRFHIVI